MSFADLFDAYDLPDGALPVRCHVLDEARASELEDYLAGQLPSCYATVRHLENRAAATGMSPGEVLANRLPDPGNIMSGDFGEIVSLFFLSSERAERTTLVKKWRYKQDRTKAALHSDVVILHKRHPNRASRIDFVICAEVKQKATPNPRYIPIEAAVESLSEDRVGRLGRALTWLREKAVDQESLERIALLNRFTVDPRVEYLKHFKAVAIIDRDLLDEEICRDTELPPQTNDFEVVVIGVNDLKTIYETVYERAVEELDSE